MSTKHISFPDYHIFLLTSQIANTGKRLEHEDSAFQATRSQSLIVLPMPSLSLEDAHA